MAINLYHPWTYGDPAPVASRLLGIIRMQTAFSWTATGSTIFGASPTYGEPEFHLVAFFNVATAGIVTGSVPTDLYILPAPSTIYGTGYSGLSASQNLPWSATVGNFTLTRSTSGFLRPTDPTRCKPNALTTATSWTTFTRLRGITSGATMPVVMTSLRSTQITMHRGRHEREQTLFHGATTQQIQSAKVPQGTGIRRWDTVSPYTQYDTASSLSFSNWFQFGDRHWTRTSGKWAAWTGLSNHVKTGATLGSEFAYVGVTDGTTPFLRNGSQTGISDPGFIDGEFVWWEST